ncbi:MAG: hypothetical protein AB4911_00865 [Oscillochloridaceae bacterium umkhey_bin13]
MPHTIAIADNDPAWLNECVELLRSEGFTIYAAGDPDGLRTLIATHNIHLVIVDRRLLANNDAWDDSGEQLAQEFGGRIPFIVMTVYDILDKFKSFRLMEPPVNGHAAVAAYFRKQDDPSELVQTTRKNLSKHAPINWAITPQDRDLFTILTATTPTLLAQRHATLDELRDLLRLLFRDYQQIHLNRTLISTDGYGLFQINAISARQRPSDRAVERFLLLCGQTELVDQIVQCFQSHNRVDGGALHLREYRARMNLAGAVLTYADDLDKVVTLSEHCQRRPDQVPTTISHLVSNTLILRQPIASPTPAPDPFALAGLDPEHLHGPALNERLEALCHAASDHRFALSYDPTTATIQLRWPTGSVSLPEPHQALLQLLPTWIEALQLRAPLYGQTGPDWILCDEQTNDCWLWDYSRIEPVGLLLGDLAQLVTSYKYLSLRGCTLYERYQLELALLDQAEVPPSVAGSFALMRAVSSETISRTQRYPQLWPITQLIYTVRFLLDYHPESERGAKYLVGYAHALVAAAFFAEQLGGQVARQQGLSLDPNTGQPLLNGQQAHATLGPSELRLLRLLMENHGKLCSREQIYCYWVHATPCDPERLSATERRDALERSRDQIDTAISRIRRAIETTDLTMRDQACYLHTVRSQGFILYLQPVLKTRR